MIAQRSQTKLGWLLYDCGKVAWNWISEFAAIVYFKSDKNQILRFIFENILNNKWKCLDKNNEAYLCKQGVSVALSDILHLPTDNLVHFFDQTAPTAVGSFQMSHRIQSRAHRHIRIVQFFVVSRHGVFRVTVLLEDHLCPYVYLEQWFSTRGHTFVHGHYFVTHMALLSHMFRFDDQNCIWSLHLGCHSGNGKAIHLP